VSGRFALLWGDNRPRGVSGICDLQIPGPRVGAFFRASYISQIWGVWDAIRPSIHTRRRACESRPQCTLGSFTGGPAGLSLGLTSGSVQFSGATSSQTATYSIAGTASTLGSVSGTYTSAVTAEFGSIPNVTVAVTGQIYSGLGTWNTNSGGNWGTISGTGQNAFGSNWGDNQGSPGLDQNYTNTDTATFGSALTSGTAVVNTNGANISLKALTFDKRACGRARGLCRASSSGVRLCV